MSAFVVSKAHIDALVSTAQAWRTPMPESHSSRMHSYVTGTELGQLLWDQNYASVNYRYSDESPAELYTPTAKRRILTPVQALKAIQCYNYQSCETPDYEKSEAYRFVEAFKSEAISRLPGYSDADWEVR